MNSKRITFQRNPFSDCGFISQYFCIAALVTVATPVLGASLGKAGFALTPYANAAFAISVFILVSINAVKAAVRGNPIGLPKETMAIAALLSLIIGAGIAIGAVEGNSKTYFLSTVLYWINWLGLLLFLNSFQPQHKVLIASASLRPWAYIIAAAAILLSLLGEGMRSQVLLSCVVFLAMYLIALRQYLASLPFALPLLLSIADTSRATVLAFLLCALLAAAVTRRGILLVGLIAFLALGYSVIASGALLEILTPGTQLYRRATEIYWLINGNVSVDSLVALNQRLFEMSAVEDFLGDLGWLGIFGGGFGHTVDMSAAPDFAVTNSALLGGGTVHNIHSLPHSLALRSGVLGLFFLATLLFQALLNAFRVWKFSIKDELTLFCTLYPVTCVAYALTASNYFLTDFILGAMVALASLRIRRHTVGRSSSKEKFAPGRGRTQNV